MRQVSGSKAEDAVVAFLEQHEYGIVDRNWRTKLCEIDIVALRRRCMYFIEVKYRRSAAQGDGFAYITAEKLWRMERAAHLWVTRHNWRGEYCLGAAAVSGDAYEVDIIASLPP